MEQRLRRSHVDSKKVKSPMCSFYTWHTNSVGQTGAAAVYPYRNFIVKRRGANGLALNVKFCRRNLPFERRRSRAEATSAGKRVCVLNNSIIRLFEWQIIIAPGETIELNQRIHQVLFCSLYFIQYKFHKSAGGFVLLVATRLSPKVSLQDQWIREADNYLNRYVQGNEEVRVSRLASMIHMIESKSVLVRLESDRR